MTIGHGISLLCLVLAVTNVQAQAQPKLPATYDPPSSIGMAKVVKGENGALQLQLLQVNVDAAFVPAMPATGGLILKVAGWIDSTMPLDGEQVKVVDVRGKALPAKVLVAKLKQYQPVLIALGKAPDPFFLQTTREDTLIVILNLKFVGGPCAPVPANLPKPK